MAQEHVRLLRRRGIETVILAGADTLSLLAAPALRAADEAFLLKRAVREVAGRQHLLATSMAKPRSDCPGSSCHLRYLEAL